MTTTLDINKIIGRNFTLIPKGSYYTTAEHDSLILWQDTNRFSWFSKGIHGRPEDWLNLVEGLNKEEISELIDSEEFSKEFSFDSYEKPPVNYPIGPKIYNEYIKSRNITPEVAKIFGLESWGDNTLIPLYNYYGKRCGSMIRDHSTNFSWLKYRKIADDEICNLWPYWLLEKTHTKPVILFEGAWSVMRYYQVASQHIVPVALLGTSANKRTIELLTGVDDVFIVLDNDKNKSGLSVKDCLEGYKDFNNKWTFVLPDKYPDEMSEAEIYRLLRAIL